MIETHWPCPKCSKPSEQTYGESHFGDFERPPTLSWVWAMMCCVDCKHEWIYQATFSLHNQAGT